MCEVLSILSHNVRGVNNAKKRRALLNIFRKSNSNILFWQETHMTVGLEEIVKAEWGINVLYFLMSQIILGGLQYSLSVYQT